MRCTVTTHVEKIGVRSTLLTSKLNFSRKAAKTQRTEETTKEGMGGQGNVKVIKNERSHDHEKYIS